MIRFALAAAALAMLAPPALAQPMPLPKSGQCPSGYRESGGYCAPTSERAPVAVPKVHGSALAGSPAKRTIASRCGGAEHQRAGARP
jgi:hypothetical protein